MINTKLRETPVPAWGCGYTESTKPNPAPDGVLPGRPNVMINAFGGFSIIGSSLKIGAAERAPRHAKGTAKAGH
jgi:hypothetical protein